MQQSMKYTQSADLQQQALRAAELVLLQDGVQAEDGLPQVIHMVFLLTVAAVTAAANRLAFVVKWNLGSHTDPNWDIHH